MTEARPARLVVLQGPTQSLTASAAVAVRQDANPLGNLLVVGGLSTKDASALRAVTLACASSREWDEVLPDEAASTPESLRTAVAGRWTIVEILLVRNWQDINETTLAAFPDARRVMYGDAFGYLNPKTGPGVASFHEATPVIPFPETAEVLHDVELRPIPREVVRNVIEKTRAALPELVKVDHELAEFGRGGLLLLPAYLTEMRVATFHGEIRHLKRLVKASGIRAHQPVIVKPHPRTSLGQVALLARELRRQGHPVRILSPLECGSYPIELFSELARSVGIAEGGSSSSVVSLSFLYGTRAQATDDYSSHGLSFSTIHRGRLIGQSAAYTHQIKVLPTWDGRSAMPPQGPEERLRTDPLHRLLWRFFVWRPVSARRHRHVSFSAGASPALLHSQTDLVRTIDEANGMTWWTPSRPGELTRPEVEPSPDLRLIRNLQQVLSVLKPGDLLELRAAVQPPTHAPLLEMLRLMASGVTEVDRASLRAEQIELLVESFADLIERSPGLERRPILHPKGSSGYVSFLARVRD